MSDVVFGERLRWDSELVGSGAGWVFSVGPGTVGRNRDDKSDSVG